MAGPEKLEGLPQPSHPISTSKPRGPLQHSPKPSSPNDSNSDPVELSPENTEYQQVLKRIAEEPNIRSDRIEKIRHALKAETYHVEADKLVDSLLRESLLNEFTTNQPGDTSTDTNSE